MSELASPAKSTEGGGGGGGDGADAELPKAMLKRILMARLQEWDAANGGDGTRSFQISKDALLACSEAGKLFIHYLTATAGDNCRDAKRQTISADDVITALSDLDFPELEEPLKAALEAFRADAKDKAKKRAEAGKKRKSSSAPAEAAAAAEAAEAEEQPAAEAMDAS